MGIYISDDELESNYNVLPNCKFSLCYLSLALSSHKFIERGGEFESKSFEFFINLSKKNLLTNKEVQIGNISILPLNYCSPFERNYCTIYFNFFSIDELTKFLEKNKIIATLNFSFGVDSFEVIYNEVINYFIKPVTSIEKRLILSNKNNDFKVNFKINVEWYAIIPKKTTKNIIKNFEKIEKDTSITSSCSHIQNKTFNISISKHINIYLKYEQTICNDPIITQKIIDLHPKLENLSNQVIYKPSDIKSDFYATNIRPLNKMGNWIIHIKDVLLSEKGFIFLHDMFPIYRQSKSFKIVIQHCIKNEDGKVLTQIRRHWTIMNFFKRKSNYTMNYRIPNKTYYIAKASVYSRIPETITDTIQEKFFYISCSIPTFDKTNEARVDQGDTIFCGILNPNEISLTETSVVKLYSELNKKDCLGYALVSFSDIKEKPHIKFHDKDNTILETNNSLSKKKQSVTNYLEGISIVYLYIYWHIQARSKNENKTPESILIEFYSRISDSKTIQGGINIIGINKCIDAFIPSNSEISQNLKIYTSSIPEDLILFNNIQELKYYLQFPHLEIFENSYSDIFSNKNLKVLEDSEFIYKCNELGIRECISITWREMMNSLFANISMETYELCLKLYKTANIFL
ncbi:uncharacterized protein cubi_03510 [Cryptosporidium ubiquitum]|uniref:Uncharacterized protein n=1 Tax=Cryptosporidium ubiquitum TaxID=857276 RepID=A0A1J4MHM6_9CRYT|nr:uncharacterized protein cubi_03510 [Cryptosporidium ubiquitum]OII73712.1 hypothetical protein cubi_03510 [Cryptosporidium ubiquitum]